MFSNYAIKLEYKVDKKKACELLKNKTVSLNENKCTVYETKLIYM